MNLFLGFLYKEIKILASYRFYFLLKLSSLIFQIIIFYYLCKLISPEYFSFLFIGLIFSKILHYVLTSLIEATKQEQYWGSFEILLMLPYKEFFIFFYMYLSKIFFLFFEILVYILLGKIFGISFTILQIFFIYLYSIFLIAICLGYTILFLASTIFIKKSDSVGWFLTSLVEIFSGVYFSTDLLPKELNFISKILPTTYLLKFMREFIGQKKLNFNLLIYPTILGILILPVSIIFLNYVIKKSLIRGNLSSY